MKRVLTIISVLASVLLAAAPATAASIQTAHSGAVAAAFTFKGSYPNYSGETLQISRSGVVVYNRPVVSSLCQTICAPASPSGKPSSVQVLDLEHNGEPDVVLGLYSGGAHCCWIDQVFSLRPATMTYVETQHDFGDPGAEIVDLTHNGRYEFRTADDSFAYTFTDYAASGLPIQILTFSRQRFHDVTRSYPRLVARDAAEWLATFKGMAKEHYQDSVGVIAAWAADEDLLGHSKLVARYLAQQQQAGHLNNLSPGQPAGKKFIAKLQRFLRQHGYLR